MTPSPDEAPGRGRAWAVLAARCAVGLVLALSGFSKLLSPPEEFALVIDSYQLIPLAAAMPLARALPWVELFVGVFLAAGFYTRASAAAAAFLLTAFILGGTSAIWRGIDLGQCGCFGKWGPQLSPAQTAALDFFLLACAGVALFNKQPFLSLDRWLSKK